MPAIKHRHVIVESLTVSVSLVARLRQTCLLSTTCIWMVSSVSPYPQPAHPSPSPLALGITDEADIMELKGSKRKKGKKIDDPDFMPTMKPISSVKEVQKIVSAIRQTQSRKVLIKLVTRIRVRVCSFRLFAFAMNEE
jgi:hypothetical protein